MGSVDPEDTFVVAETVNQAKDACELINIEYEDLPAVVSPWKAIQNDAPNIWEEIPNNICFEWELGNKDETEKAFKKTDVIIDFTIPKCTLEILEIASKLKKKVVIGTTGFTQKEEGLIKKYSKKFIYTAYRAI